PAARSAHRSIHRSHGTQLCHYPRPASIGMRRLGWMTALEARGVSLTAMTRADRLCSVEKTKPETVRSALLVVNCLEVLHAADRPLSPAEVLAAVGDRIGEFTDHETELHPRGHRRWELALRWL